MNSLRLGDIGLDPRRVVRIDSLEAVVCAELPNALRVSGYSALRRVVERIDSIVQDLVNTAKSPALVLLGPLSDNDTSILGGIHRRWGHRLRIVCVGEGISSMMSAYLDSLGIEVHCELMWGRYRFSAPLKPEAGRLDIALFSIEYIGNFGIELKRRALFGFAGAFHLPLFLKGFGRLMLPSFEGPIVPASEEPPKEFDRFDLFAIGHKRVLPLGKLQALRTGRAGRLKVPIRGLSEKFHSQTTL